MYSDQWTTTVSSLAQNIHSDIHRQYSKLNSGITVNMCMYDSMYNICMCYAVWTPEDINRLLNICDVLPSLQELHYTTKPAEITLIIWSRDPVDWVYGKL